MNALKKTLAAAALLSVGAAAFAQATPAGLWKTIDDETKAEKSYVRVVEVGGVFTAKVEKVLDPAKADAKCDKCGICTKACPMDIPEIHHDHGRKAFNEDCTLCGRCAEFCPDDSVIRIRFGPWSVFSSSRAYYKARLQFDNPEGIVKPLKFVRKTVSATAPDA
mgnify:CR=1 FL=1